MSSLSQQQIMHTPEGAVSVSYETLLTAPDSLLTSIEEAFGAQPDCLGIIVVQDLPPEYVTARERLLKLAYHVAKLDDATKEQLVDPKSRYSFGWSHGKEIMNGRADVLKGSYYANPVIDMPDVSPALQEAYPEYHGKNIWPSDEIQEVQGFEQAFKDLGKFMLKVGCQLATACQPFVSTYLSDSSLSLADIIRSSQILKARLLHYFPPSQETFLATGKEPVDSWCGFHCDHSLLTGLCSAMYLREEANGGYSIVESPSPDSGLYIHTRGGALTKISIPANCLAFQTGEALEVTTAGKLRATPHCVRVGMRNAKCIDKISRETFALFMGPNVDLQLSPSENFGQFSKRIFTEHYGAVPTMM